MFCDMLRKHFDGVKATFLDSSTWTQISRQRVYIAAFSSSLGGERAAAAWVGRINEIVRFRRIKIPTP
eukprot:1424571-Lingulodinium_polyedra.AAC.1